LSEKLWREGVRDGETLRYAIREKEDKLTFGVVFPYSSHNFLFRRWLRTNGINPDRDVHMVVVPPPQMPANMKAGNLDGYCVGEPWNSVAVLARYGWCAATSRKNSHGAPRVCRITRGRT
jgi:ABC-type nitrate/sulfonate/bicarbonate transport system substrate-binding protein